MYCCAINCSSNTNSTNPTLDPRTDRPVRMHKFPDPVKEKDRCLQWIYNLRRADLNLQNIKYKRVCSSHFDFSAYNCVTDIASSSLMGTAVPTLVGCRYPPECDESSRKSPSKKTILEREETDVASSSLMETAEPTLVGRRYPPECDESSRKLPAKRTILEREETDSDNNCEPEQSTKTLKVETETHTDNSALEKALEQIKKLKNEKYQLTRRLKRAKEKRVNDELSALKKIGKSSEKTPAGNLPKYLCDILLITLLQMYPQKWQT